MKSGPSNNLSQLQTKLNYFLKEKKIFFVFRLSQLQESCWKDKIYADEKAPFSKKGFSLRRVN